MQPSSKTIHDIMDDIAGRLWILRADIYCDLIVTYQTSNSKIRRIMAYIGIKWMDKSGIMRR